ncbi:ABC-three component system middle component 4 [Bacillus cereus]
MLMNKQMSFIIPEMDLDFRLARLLIMFEKLSYSSRGNPVLNLEKVAVFEFLIKYPHILKLVLQNLKSEFENSA